MTAILIKERSLLDFIRNPVKDKYLQSPNEPTVTISKDFEHMGFCNVVIAPPRGQSWTYTPFVACSERGAEKLCSGVPRTVQKRLREIGDYLESHGIRERAFPMGIFHAYPGGNENKLLPLGVFWSVTVPVETLEAFLSWLDRIMERLLEYACPLQDRMEEDWRTALFWTKGNAWSVHVFTEVTPPMEHLKNDCSVLYNGLLTLEKKYDEQGEKLFCARNAWRQKEVAFPYCCDNYEEWNEYPLRLIKKRIELVRKIDIPHFYHSIDGKQVSGMRNAREQLEHMIQTNRGRRLVAELEGELGKLNEWIDHAKQTYGELLCFHDV